MSELSQETERALERALGAVDVGINGTAGTTGAIRRPPAGNGKVIANREGGYPHPLPDQHLPPAPQREQSPLEVLYDVLSKDENDVPRIGLEASQSMASLFDQVCADIMRVANDARERANALYAEAENFVTVVQDSKRVMCANIEDEARRAAKVGIALRETAKLMRSPRPQE